MTAYYIDPSAGVNGTGTAASPFNTWTGVPVGAGNQYFQKRGTSWTGTFPTLTAGTSGNLTLVSSYYNADGTDDTTQAKPILNLGDSAMAVQAFMKVTNMDVRNNRTTLSASTAAISIVGSDSEVSSNSVSTNLAGIGGTDLSRVTVANNVISCATANTANLMQGVFVSNTANQSNITITGNTITVGTAGTTIRGVYCVNSGGVNSNVLVKDNPINVSGVVTGIASHYGVSITNAASPEVTNNTVTGLSIGLNINAGCSNPYVHHNTVTGCVTYGINVASTTGTPLIEWNKARRNNTNIYADSTNQSHLIRFNDTSLASGTSGIGIRSETPTGIIYGNTCYKNTIGIALSAASGADDTGGRIVTGNYLIQNTSQQIRAAGVKGTKSVIVNNLCVGGNGGISEDSACSNIEKIDNVFQSQTQFAIASLPSYVRNSIGTYFDFQGVMRQAGVGAQRFNYNPASLSAGGTNLYEKAATNLIKPSSDFDQWLTAHATVQTSAAIAPDASKTAEGLGADSVATRHLVYGPNITLVAGTAYTASIYVKAGAKSAVALNSFPGSGSDVRTIFNLTGNGSVVSSTAISPSVTLLANGWYRVSHTFIATLSGTTQYAVQLAPHNGTTTDYVGDNTTIEIYIWGAQLEVTSVTSGAVVATPSLSVGWSSGTSSSGAVSGSELVVTALADYGRQVYAVSGLTVGATYQLSGSVRRVSGTCTALLGITNLATGQNTVAITTQSASAVFRTIIFVATATTHYISAGVTDAGSNGTVAAVSGMSVSAVTLGAATSYIPSATAFSSRASQKSYYNQSGVLSYAGNDQPAYDYDPATLRYENLLKLSEGFTNQSVWVPTGSATLTAAAAVAPDGSNNATYFTSGSYISQTVVSATPTMTFSFYVKAAAGTTSVRYYAGSATSYGTGVFTFATGTATFASSAGTPANLSATAVNVGSGWFRVAVTLTVDANTSWFVQLNCAGAYIWGAQLNSGSTALEYKRTDANPVPKQYMEKGLSVEGAGTNLWTNTTHPESGNWTKSATTVIGNYAKAPDGSYTAAKVIPQTTTDAYKELFQNVSVTAGKTYCLSVYVKADGYNYVAIVGTGPQFGTTFTFNADLSTGTETMLTIGNATLVGHGIIPVGNGWYRMWAALTCLSSVSAAHMALGVIQTATSPRGTAWAGDGVNGIQYWGAQFEEGNAPSTYIPSGDVFNSRGSTATYFDQTGTMQTAAANVARYTYDPGNLSTQPWLMLEGAATNYIRNNTMAGAVVGSPGTLPTNWSVQRTVNGITNTVVGAGQEDGIDYIDISFSGTATATASFFINTDSISGSSPAIPATSGQTWSGSMFIKKLSGTMPDSNARVNISGIDSTGAGVEYSPNYSIPNDSVTPLRGQRASLKLTLAGATTVGLLFYVTIGFNTGTTANVTFRIGLPQLEQGSVATSPIRTTGTSASRSADVYTSSTGSRAADVVVASTATRAADTPNIRNNIYKPGIPMIYGDTTVDGSGNPAPVATSVVSWNGDRVADPMLDAAAYTPLAGSPLLDSSWRDGIGFNSVPWPVSDA